MGVEQLAGECLGVDSRSQQPGGSRVGARVRPPEAAGVGHQAGVEAARDRLVQHYFQGVEQLENEHCGGVSAGIYQMVGTESVVGGVVVDHQHGAGGIDPVG